MGAEKNQWERGYAHAHDYFMTHQDLNIPNQYTCDDGFRLGAWIHNLRTSYRMGKLTAEKIEQLDNIGMVWDKETLRFETEMSHAKEYFAAFGNLDVPSDYVCEDGYRLGAWLRIVRPEYRKGKLSQRKIQELEKLGIVWDPMETAWENGYLHAKAYYEEHGGRIAPAKYICEDGYKLGQWIQGQKKSLKRGKLSSERMQMLKEIGIG
ncbi:MAG: helicase associated domain-containing protein [Ruminococcus flavefaciens]|nr:helicase associated domain-containing protein [Ruminococcus flavefaciens]